MGGLIACTRRGWNQIHGCDQNSGYACAIIECWMTGLKV